jgi:outer membrane lipoprotein-sorting protein
MKEKGKEWACKKLQTNSKEVMTIQVNEMVKKFKSLNLKGVKIMRCIPIIMLIFTFTIFSHVHAQELTALEVLRKSDAVINAPKDQNIKMKLKLIDANGDEKERELSMLQKGGEKRMIKFLYPADQRGIAFLDLPDDIMYLYLPAFKKVRRIAGHIKNQKFAGTDMTYDDMGTLNYAEEYDPTLIDKTEEAFVLELTPKKGIKKDYSKLKMWIRTDNFYHSKVEYYDKGGKLIKTMERRKIEKVGDYWFSKEFEIHDLRDGHKTKAILMEIEFDTGLKDNIFTQRYLKR